MYFYKDIFSGKKKILFVGAHPDDIVVFFGGTISKLTNDHKEVFVLDVTAGGRGSRDSDISEQDLEKIRLQEEGSALEILGVDKKHYKSLKYSDGEVENNLDLIGKISKEIRDFRPDIVCTHEPKDCYFQFRKTDKSYINHRDHRNTGLSVLDSVYPFSRDKSFFKEHLENGLKTHSLFEILLTGEAVQTARFDITDVVDLKRQALLKFTSQFTQNDVEDILLDYKEDDKFYEFGHYLNLAF